MTDVPDDRLLEQFARNGSEAAFAALVQRHIALVHSVALRHTANPQHAQDITQAVFIILARKAGRLGRKTILPGWLYHTARLTAANFQRAETRRLCREQEAFMQSKLEESSTDNLWCELSPQLDEAMAGLGTSERDALVLRYFQNKSMVEVAKSLGLAENTAQKRVGRALEKLRKFFAKRGVSLTTAIIAGAISANSVQAAPACLTKTISAVTVTEGTTASGLTLALVKGMLKTMIWNKIKMATLIGATLLTTGMAGFAVLEQSQGNAKIPYKMLDDASQIIAGVNQSNLLLRMTFSSERVSQPTNIHLTIQSAKRGPIQVQLANDGQLLNFPLDEELHRENPFVVSDLPKGSLISSFMMRFPPFGTNFSYNRLDAGVMEINKAIERAKQLPLWSAARHMLPFKKEVQGIIFLFPPSLAGKGKIQILSATGQREYTADARGRIKIKLDKSLEAENPEVTVSHKSYVVLPDME